MIKRTIDQLVTPLSSFRMFKEQLVVPPAQDIVQQVEALKEMYAENQQQLDEQEQQEKELSEKYKLIFENSIIGLSFYTADGWLMTANAEMRRICHFDNEESDAFFSKMNLFEMSPFDEVLDPKNVQEYWACSLSIVPERDMRVYLEIRVHPVFDEEGQMTCISVAARDMTAERDMYIRLKENDRQLQKANKAIQTYEHELRYMMESCEMQAWRISLERQVIEFYQGLSTVVRSFPLVQLQKIFVDQEHPFVKALAHPEEAIAKPLSYIGQMYPVVTQTHSSIQWVQINSIPEYDDEGKLTGSFGVWRNINQLMSKQEELKQETQRANESGHMKSVFLANMTHEIRTPLNAIVGFSDVLQMIDSPDEKREMIRVIHNNCDMLLRLINDFFVVSSLDESGITLEKSEVDFAQLFNEECKTLKHRIEEGAAQTGTVVEFQTDAGSDSLMAYMDSGRIRQVMTNFITNAVKYTHQGYIRLGWREEERNGKEGLYIYCEDTGEGIEKEVQEKIFDRFFKVNDYIQGTGLGLAICKAIVDACQGEIGIRSEGKGQGSTFWIWVPIRE
jgi:signal transduction histidine kinase